MSRHIDLHVHTTASDGTLSPSEAVMLAKERGLSAIAITDHDTADGVTEAMAAGRETGLEVIPGIEISVDYKGYGVHILGYFIDPDCDALEELLAWVVAERERRNAEIAAAMAADGLRVSMSSLHEKHPDSVIGRPHFAAELVEAGLVKSVGEGFEKYLSPGGKYYRRRQYIPLELAFDVITRAGGKAVFAHPYQYGFSPEEMERLLNLLISRGLDGIECIYSGYTSEQTEYLKTLAAKYGLCVTGGSDFHGSGKPHIQMGSPAVPYELLEVLKAPSDEGAVSEAD